MSTKTITNEAAALKRQLQADLAAAHSHTDPNLSPEGLTQKRNELAAAARQRNAAALDTLRTQMAAEASAVGERAAKARPRVDGATLSRKWDQVRMRLDAGIPPLRIVAKADAETLAAIKEYGEAWFETQHHTHQPSGLTGTQADTATWMEHLNNSIDARLIEIGDPDTREAIQADREARAAVAEFAQHAAHVSRLVAGTPSNPLEAAVAAAQAGQAASAGLAAE